MGWTTDVVAEGIISEWMDSDDDKFLHDNCIEGCVEHKVTIEFKTYEEQDTRENQGDYEESEAVITIDGKELTEDDELPAWLTPAIVDDIKAYGRNTPYHA